METQASQLFKSPEFIGIRPWRYVAAAMLAICGIWGMFEQAHFSLLFGIMVNIPYLLLSALLCFGVKWKAIGRANFIFFCIIALSVMGFVLLKAEQLDMNSVYYTEVAMFEWIPSAIIISIINLYCNFQVFPIKSSSRLLKVFLIKSSSRPLTLSRNAHKTYKNWLSPAFILPIIAIFFYFLFYVIDSILNWILPTYDYSITSEITAAIGIPWRWGLLSLAWGVLSYAIRVEHERIEQEKNDKRTLLSVVSAVLILCIILLSCSALSADIWNFSTTVLEEDISEGCSVIEFLNTLIQNISDPKDALPEEFLLFEESEVNIIIGILVAILILAVIVVVAIIVSAVHIIRILYHKPLSKGIVIFAASSLLLYGLLSLTLVLYVNGLIGEDLEFLGITLTTHTLLPTLLGILPCIACILMNSSVIMEKIKVIFSAIPVASEHTEKTPSESETISLLMQYKDLLDKGVITEEEFQEKKAALLTSKQPPQE